MTLDDDNWIDYFDSITSRGERLRATVALGRVPLSPARERRGGPDGGTGGLLDGIRYNPASDDVEICIWQGGAPAGRVRYFVPSPRSVTVEEGEGSKLICVTDSGGLRTMISLISLEAASAALQPGRHRHSV